MNPSPGTTRCYAALSDVIRSQVVHCPVVLVETRVNHSSSSSNWNLGSVFGCWVQAQSIWVRFSLWAESNYRIVWFSTVTALPLIVILHFISLWPPLAVFAVFFFLKSWNVEPWSSPGLWTYSLCSLANGSTLKKPQAGLFSFPLRLFLLSLTAINLLPLESNLGASRY